MQEWTKFGVKASSLAAGGGREGWQANQPAPSSRVLIQLGHDACQGQSGPLPPPNHRTRSVTQCSCISKYFKWGPDQDARERKYDQEHMADLYSQIETAKSYPIIARYCCTTATTLILDWFTITTLLLRRYYIMDMGLLTSPLLLFYLVITTFAVDITTYYYIMMS